MQILPKVPILSSRRGRDVIDRIGLVAGWMGRSAPGFGLPGAFLIRGGHRLRWLVALLVMVPTWVRCWKASWGTALRGALVWAALAIALGLLAQVVSWLELLESGRPWSGRLTYLMVLAVLAGLVSVLGARNPGGGAWAILMVLLVVVLLIPWLEAGGRVRTGPGAGRVPSRFALELVLRAPGRCGRHQLSAHPVRRGGLCPGRRARARIPGADANRLGCHHPRGDLAGRGMDPGAELRAGGVACRQVIPGEARTSSGSGSGSATTGAWSGPSGSRNDSTGPPSLADGPSG